MELGLAVVKGRTKVRLSLAVVRVRTIGLSVIVLGLVVLVLAEIDLGCCAEVVVVVRVGSLWRAGNCVCGSVVAARKT